MRFRKSVWWRDEHDSVGNRQQRRLLCRRKLWGKGCLARLANDESIKRARKVGGSMRTGKLVARNKHEVTQENERADQEINVGIPTVQSNPHTS